MFAVSVNVPIYDIAYIHTVLTLSNYLITVINSRQYLLVTNVRNRINMWMLQVIQTWTDMYSSTGLVLRGTNIFLRKDFMREFTRCFTSFQNIKHVQTKELKLMFNRSLPSLSSPFSTGFLLFVRQQTDKRQTSTCRIKTKNVPKKIAYSMLLFPFVCLSVFLTPPQRKSLSS